MRPKNPCWGCESSLGGCGKHSECPRYLAFFEERKKESKRREHQNMLNDYTTKEIEKAKIRGCHDTFRRCRNHGRMA